MQSGSEQRPRAFVCRLSATELVEGRCCRRLPLPAAMSTIGLSPLSSNVSLSSASTPVVASVELSTVWLLLAGFALACLLLSAVGGVKWRRHKRRDELAYSQKASESGEEGAAAESSGAVASTASSQLAAFSRQLHSQHASTVSLLSEQQSSVRSQLDRLCAEAEQLKALLAARLSGDRGFVDAAIALLLSDITAAESYRRRQGKREEEALRGQQDCLARLDEAMHALQAAASGSGSAGGGALSGQSSVGRVKECAESVIRCVSSCQRECDKERARVRHSSASSSSILGAEAVALLTRHADDEAEAERAISRLLHAAHTAADNFLFHCLEHDMEANASSSSGKGGGRSGGSGSSSVYLHRLQLTCRRYHGEMARSVSAWPAVVVQLSDTRAARSSDETEALQSLERQKAQVDSEASRGLFAGLDQQLVDSIAQLIRQTAAVADRHGSGQHALQLSATAGSTGATVVSHAALSTSLVTALLDSASQAAADATGDSVNPFQLDGSSASAVSADSLSAVVLAASFSEWREGDALLSGLLSAEAARKLAVCSELDRSTLHAALPAAESARLQEAAGAVTALHASHSAALVRLSERGRAEEQRAVEQRLAALREAERENERRRESLQADFDARMASRAAEAAAGDEADGGSAARLQAEFDAAMEALQSERQQAALTAQTELHAIHQQHRQRLAAAQSELRRAQQQQMADASRLYEQTHRQLTEAADEKCHRDLQLEGVDVPSLRAATLAALHTPSARETALVAFHAANMTELSHKQQSERRVLEEEVEQRHRAHVEALRAEWEDSTDRQRAVAEEEYEQQVRAADSTTAAVLRSQHADESRRREKRWQEDWSAQAADSAQQHNAALDSRREQQAAEQAAERAAELSDQRDEMFQVRLAACKTQEATLLEQALHAGTRADGRRVIESAMASRHSAERARAIAAQELDNKQLIARALEADRAALSERRQRIQRESDEGRLSESEAAAALSALEADGSPAAVSQRVFAAVANSVAASLTGLQSRQWDEVKAAMLRAFPDEAFSGGEWQQRGSLSPDVAALAAAQAAVLQSAVEASREHVASLEREEQAAVRECLAEQQQRMEQLDDKLAAEEAAIRAQFEQQLAAARGEHEAKLAQLVDDRQRVSEQQPVDIRAVAEYDAAIEEERQSHALVMEQAAEQFEAELAMRSEAARVHLRAANQLQLNEAMRHARSERVQQEKDASAEQSRVHERVKEDARRAMQLLERRGRRHRVATQLGVQRALQALVSRHTSHPQPQAAPHAQAEGSAACVELQVIVTRVSAEGAAATSASPASQAAVGAQLDRIEALLRHMAPLDAGSAGSQQAGRATVSPDLLPLSASSAASAGQLLATPIAASSLTARQAALAHSVQRVQAAVSDALSLPALQLRLADATLAATLAPACDTDCCALLPLSHLYTLLPGARVLLLHDQPAVGVAQHCLALCFLHAARRSHFTEATHSAEYQSALLLALTAALSTQQQQQPLDYTPAHSDLPVHSGIVHTQHAADSVVQPGNRAEKKAGSELAVSSGDRADALNERLCALLAEQQHPVAPAHLSADSRQVQLLLEAIAQFDSSSAA